jgi:phosphoribosylformylglycinamidine synthase
VGKIDSISEAITPRIKTSNSSILMIGERSKNLGGSVLAELIKKSKKARLPELDIEKAKDIIHTMYEITKRYDILSCHDISDGGLITTLTEMLICGEREPEQGLTIDINPIIDNNNYWQFLFSEDGGFVFEVNKNKVKEIIEYGISNNVNIYKIGDTIDDKMIIIKDGNETLVKLNLDILKNAWDNGIKEIFE